MDKGKAFFLCQPVGVTAGFIEYIAFQNDFRAVSLRPVYLHERRCRRHHDGRGDSGQLRGVCHALSMIAGGSGN